LRREANSPWELDRVRQDVIVRARNAFDSGLVTEIFAGRSTLDETVAPDVEGEPDVNTERSSLQAGVRAGWQLGRTALGSSLRYRSFDDMPVGEARFDA